MLAYMGRAARRARSPAALERRVMIRFTWRQFRTQAGGPRRAGGRRGRLAVTGPHLVHLYDTTVATCRAAATARLATSAFLRTTIPPTGPGSLLSSSRMIGIFWGAPLVARELETGTYRLVWTQGVTRRWLAVKLALSGWRAWPPPGC